NACLAAHASRPATRAFPASPGMVKERLRCADARRMKPADIRHPPYSCTFLGHTKGICRNGSTCPTVQGYSIAIHFVSRHAASPRGPGRKVVLILELGRFRLEVGGQCAQARRDAEIDRRSRKIQQDLGLLAKVHCICHLTASPCTGDVSLIL